jgi:hypothetical protein
MPALPSVSKVLRFVLEQTLGEDIHVINRMFLNYSGAAPTNAQLNTTATDTMTAWGSNMASMFVTPHKLVGVTIEDLSSATSAVGSAAGSIAGSHSETGLAAGTALVVKLAVARRYRGGHPRQYFCGQPVAALADEQTWSAGQIAAFTTNYFNFIDAIEASVTLWGTSSEQVNVSYYQGFTNHTFPSGRIKAIPTLRGTPLVDIIGLVSVNPKVGSQRRRNLQST